VIVPLTSPPLTLQVTPKLPGWLVTLAVSFSVSAQESWLTAGEMATAVVFATVIAIRALLRQS